MLVFDWRKDEFMFYQRLWLDSAFSGLIPTERGLFVDKLEELHRRGYVFVTDENVVDIKGFQENLEYFRFLVEAEDCVIEITRPLDTLLKGPYDWGSLNLRTKGGNNLKEALFGIQNKGRILEIKKIANQYGLEVGRWKEHPAMVANPSKEPYVDNARERFFERMINVKGESQCVIESIWYEYLQSYVRYHAVIHGCNEVLMPNGMVESA